MIRFIHTADIHYGMENYGHIDPATGIHTRLLDFDRALSFCIDTAIEQKVDFFLFCGDAYKTASPTPTQQKLFFRNMLRLRENNIPAVLVIGNHDHPLSFGKAHALELFGDLPLDNFHVVSRPQILPLRTRGGIVNIVGIPWPTRNTVSLSSAHLPEGAHQITDYISRAVARIIVELAAQLNEEVPAVLAAHLTVSNGIFSGSEKRAIYGTDPLLLPSQLAIPPFDYVALGHLHRYQNVNGHGYPAVVYSGSIERVDFGERNEEKGFCLVTIEGKNKTTHQFIKTPTRPFILLELVVPEGQDPTACILEKLAQHSLDGAIIKIVYHLSEGASDTLNGKIIQKACARAASLVSIVGIKKPLLRNRRKALGTEKSFIPLLEQFFEENAECRPYKERLMRKIESLQQEGEQGEPQFS